MAYDDAWRGVHALDIEDYDSDNQCMKIRHHPETGTPIKNPRKSERLVALLDQVCDVLDDWLTKNRPSVTDKYGREPILASCKGRTNKTTLRAYVYRWTRPCTYSAECPHDRDLGECSALERDTACRCPSSVSPHAIR